MCFLLHYDITVCFLKVGICRQGSHILETFQTWREIGAKNQLEIREGSWILERIETKATTFIISTCHQVATDPHFVIRLRWSRTRVASTSLTDNMKYRVIRIGRQWPSPGLTKLVSFRQNNYFCSRTDTINLNLLCFGNIKFLVFSQVQKKVKTFRI